MYVDLAMVGASLIWLLSGFNHPSQALVWFGALYIFFLAIF